MRTGRARCEVDGGVGGGQLRDVRGATVMLVEQNAAMALEVADFGYVLETGRVTLSAPALELKARSDVIEAYLG